MQRSKAANPFLQAASCPLWKWEDVFPLRIVSARCIFIASLFSEVSSISGCQRRAVRHDGPSVCSAVTHPELYCVLVYVGRALMKSVRSLKKKIKIHISYCQQPFNLLSIICWPLDCRPDELGLEGFEEKIVKVWKWSSFPAAV